MTRPIKLAVFVLVALLLAFLWRASAAASPPALTVEYCTWTVGTWVNHEGVSETGHVVLIIAPDEGATHFAVEVVPFTRTRYADNAWMYEGTIDTYPGGYIADAWISADGMRYRFHDLPELPRCGVYFPGVWK